MTQQATAGYGSRPSLDIPATRDTLSTMFEYTQWADDRLLTACSVVTDDQYCRHPGGDAPSIREAVTQLATAAQLWSARLEWRTLSTTAEGEDPFSTLAAAKNEVAHAHDVFAREATRPPEDLEEALSYRDEQGATVLVPRWMALRHVATQAVHHRGQLAVLLRHVDVTPPPTDFLHWTIEQQKAENNAP